MGEIGVNGFSVDEVSRRCGVAKTTIYRHWPRREDLILDACSRMAAEYSTPDTGTLIGDLSAFVRDIATMLQEAAWPSVLPSIIDTAERNPDFAALHSRIQRGHAAPVRTIVGRAVERGELADGQADVTVAAILGPLFYRRWFSREALDASFLDQIVDAAVKTIAHPGR